MMRNKKGMIILSIILVVQFIIPLSVWGYENYKNKELKEKGQEVKLLVDTIYYDERGVVFKINALEEIIHKRDMNYIEFENVENGFTRLKEVAGLPSGNMYISENRLYSLYSEDWGFKYKVDIADDGFDYGYRDLYDREIEKANIEHGFCEGPETQAYAVFKVYKNRLEVVSVYIGSESIEQVVEKEFDYEWDSSRYEVNYDYGLGYEDGHYYREYYDEALDEYVTEPVAA